MIELAHCPVPPPYLSSSTSGGKEPGPGSEYNNFSFSSTAASVHRLWFQLFSLRNTHQHWFRRHCSAYYRVHAESSAPPAHKFLDEHSEGPELPVDEIAGWSFFGFRVVPKKLSLPMNEVAYPTGSNTERRWFSRRWKYYMSGSSSRGIMCRSDQGTKDCAEWCTGHRGLSTADSRWV
jgi:hypothetical protein